MASELITRRRRSNDSGTCIAISDEISIHQLFCFFFAFVWRQLIHSYYRAACCRPTNRLHLVLFKKWGKNDSDKSSKKLKTNSSGSHERNNWAAKSHFLPWHQLFTWISIDKTHNGFARISFTWFPSCCCFLFSFPFSPNFISVYSIRP